MPDPALRITDATEGLIRRVYKHSPKRFRPVIVQLTQRPRAPAAAFELRLPVAVRLTVGDCDANGLEAFADPVPGNPHHGSIWDLVAIHRRDPDSYERTIDPLAKACSILPDIA